MNHLDLRTYRRFISVVTQETILFDGTIRDNIAYGIPDARDEDIFRAVQAANLTQLIRELPEGLSTSVRENGSRLSGGQRQQCGAESRRRDAAYPPPGSPVTRHTRSFNVLRPCCTIRARVHHVVYGIRLDAEPPPAV